MTDAERHASYLTVGQHWEPGDQPPSVYNDWHEWANVQHRAGLRQARCGFCGLWKYPQELHRKRFTFTANTRKDGAGQTVTMTYQFCNACWEANK